MPEVVCVEFGVACLALQARYRRQSNVLERIAWHTSRDVLGLLDAFRF